MIRQFTQLIFGPTSLNRTKNQLPIYQKSINKKNNVYFFPTLPSDIPLINYVNFCHEDLMPKTHLTNICIILAQATFKRAARICRICRISRDDSQCYANRPVTEQERDLEEKEEEGGGWHQRNSARAPYENLCKSAKGYFKGKDSIGKGRMLNYSHRLISYVFGIGIGIGTVSGSGLSLGWRIEIEVDLPIVAIIEWHGLKVRMRVYTKVTYIILLITKKVPRQNGNGT